MHISQECGCLMVVESIKVQLPTTSAPLDTEILAISETQKYH